MSRVTSHPVRVAIRDLVRQYGSVTAVARHYGLSRYQVAVLAGEAPVYDGTIALAAARLGMPLEPPPRPMA